MSEEKVLDVAEDDGEQLLLMPDEKPQSETFELDPRLKAMYIFRRREYLLAMSDVLDAEHILARELVAHAMKAEQFYGENLEVLPWEMDAAGRTILSQLTNRLTAAIELMSVANKVLNVKDETLYEVEQLCLRSIADDRRGARLKVVAEKQ